MTPDSSSHESVPTASDASRWMRWAPWFIMFIGAVLRIRQYEVGRSFWTDEAALALGIAETPWTLLHTWIPNCPAGPIGFMQVSKLASLTLGSSEYALRLFPILCSIVSLPCFYFLAKRCISPVGSIFALLFFAVSEHVIFYGAEFHPYAGDILAAIAILWMMTWIRDADLTLKTTCGCACAGIAAILFSFPVIFVIAGSGGVMGLLSLFHRNRRQLYYWIALVMIWALVLLGYYLASIRQLSKDPDRQGYWVGLFLPMIPKNTGDIARYMDAFKALFDKPAGLTLFGLAAFAWITGGLTLLRTSPVRLCILIAPILVTAAASVLHQYPFGDRLLIFLTAPVLILIGEGIAAVGRSTIAYAPVASVCMAGLLLSHPAHTALHELRHPSLIQEARPVLAELEKMAQPGDAIYLDTPVQQRYDYYVGYAHDYPALKHVETIRPAFGTLPQFAHLPMTHSEKRVWVLFTHISESQEKKYLAELDTIGELQHTLQAPGVSGYLYQIR